MEEHPLDRLSMSQLFNLVTLINKRINELDLKDQKHCENKMTECYMELRDEYKNTRELLFSRIKQVERFIR